MKISNQKIFTNVLQQGLNVSRTSSNIISVSNNSEIPFEILLPENFDLEKEALQQLVDFAHFTSAKGTKMKCACATPDFHKGSTIPVGSVVVTPENLVIPSAIGTDINCGMRLHKTGLNLEQFLSKKKEIVALLKGDLLEGTRDIPTTGVAMTALFQDGLSAFWNEMSKEKNHRGIFSKIDFKKVENELYKLHESAFISGNSKYAPEALTHRDWMRDPSFGTLGGGNHFCEFQVISQIKDKRKAFELGLKVGDVVYMIHTGSRDVGFFVGNRWMDKAKELYPAGIKHPKNKIYAIEDDFVEDYLQAMHSAAHYATANRAIIAEVIRQRINEVVVNAIADNDLITDVPHNIILKEKIGNVHRKGATPAYEGQLLLIPGSMGHDSYLLSGLGNDKWLQSASHGAGRNYSRNTISFKGKKDFSLLGLDGIECITLKEERMIEEAPAAYKEIGEVIRTQVEEEIVDPVAVFSPLLTFKA